MQVFTRLTDNGSTSRVLLFGAGLVGQAVTRQLQIAGYTLSMSEPTDWSNPAPRGLQLASLRASLEDEANQTVQPLLHLAWCAGSGSFSARQEDLLDERAAFEDVFSMFHSVSSARPTSFHFVSSAGALFEGQQWVNAASAPRPRHPYGDMKLEQESRLEDLPASTRVRIYRPSTVYGSHAYHRRAGLISHLLWNALHNRPTTLEANVHSMRDYVYVEDVGRDIVHEMEKLQGPTATSAYRTTTRFQVSTKPTSIFEIVQRIERLLGRSLQRCFNRGGGNDADITFRHDIRPDGWHPTPLETGLSAALRLTRASYLQEA